MRQTVYFAPLAVARLSSIPLWSPASLQWQWLLNSRGAFVHAGFRDTDTTFALMSNVQRAIHQVWSMARVQN